MSQCECVCVSVCVSVCVCVCVCVRVGVCASAVPHPAPFPIRDASARVPASQGLFSWCAPGQAYASLSLCARDLRTIPRRSELTSLFACVVRVCVCARACLCDVRS